MAVKPSADSNTASVSADVFLEVNEQAPESTYLRRTFLSPVKKPLTLAIAYYHPLVEMITYSDRSAGMNKKLRMAGGRQLSMNLQMALLTHEQRRRLLPNADGVSLTVRVSPGLAGDEWLWPDGVHLRRVHFQPPGQEGVGIRFLVRNGSEKTLIGLRLLARLVDPEIGTEAPAARGGRDDEVAADPRAAMVYQSDPNDREDGFIAYGWGPQGGLISSGDSWETEETDPDLDEPLAVHLESMAVDLSPGQSLEAYFWIVKAGDQASAARGLLRLRQNPNFSVWEDQVEWRRSQGMNFTSSDPYLTYLFMNLKGYSRWMERNDAFGNRVLVSNSQTEPASASDLALAAGGWVLLGQGQFIRDYLDAWFEQRFEVQDPASLLLAAHAYFRFSQDRRWLAASAERIGDLLNALADLDQNDDGLPEFTHPTDLGADDMDPFALQLVKNRQGVQWLDPSLKAISALRQGSALLETVGGQENHFSAAKFQVLAEQAQQTMGKTFWKPGSGSQGFFVYGRIPEKNQNAPVKSAAAIGAVLNRIGTPEQQAAVFQEVWGNPAWWDPRQICRTVPTDDPAYFGEQTQGQGRVSFRRSHEVFLAGLTSPDGKTATEACDRLRAYARSVVLDPSWLGFMSSAPNVYAGADLAAFNYLELLWQGLGGVDVQVDGFRVRVPPYLQDLDLKVQNASLAGVSCDLTVSGPGGGEAVILINNHKVAPGTLIPWSEIKGKKLDIQILRSAPPAPKPTRKPTPPAKGKKKKKR